MTAKFASAARNSALLIVGLVVVVLAGVASVVTAQTAQATPVPASTVTVVVDAPSALAGGSVAEGVVGNVG